MKQPDEFAAKQNVNLRFMREAQAYRPDVDGFAADCVRLLGLKEDHVDLLKERLVFRWTRLRTLEIEIEAMRLLGRPDRVEDMHNEYSEKVREQLPFPEAQQIADEVLAGLPEDVRAAIAKGAKGAK